MRALPRACEARARPRFSYSINQQSISMRPAKLVMDGNWRRESQRAIWNRSENPAARATPSAVLNRPPDRASSRTSARKYCGAPIRACFRSKSETPRVSTPGPPSQVLRQRTPPGPAGNLEQVRSALARAHGVPCQYVDGNCRDPLPKELEHAHRDQRATVGRDARRGGGDSRMSRWLGF